MYSRRQKLYVMLLFSSVGSRFAFCALCYGFDSQFDNICVMNVDVCSVYLQINYMYSISCLVPISLLSVLYIMVFYFSGFFIFKIRVLLLVGIFQEGHTPDVLSKDIK